MENTLLPQDDLGFMKYEGQDVCEDNAEVLYYSILRERHNEAYGLTDQVEFETIKAYHDESLVSQQDRIRSALILVDGKPVIWFCQFPSKCHSCDKTLEGASVISKQDSLSPIHVFHAECVPAWERHQYFALSSYWDFTCDKREEFQATDSLIVDFTSGETPPRSPAELL